MQSRHEDVHLCQRLLGRDVRLQTTNGPDNVIVTALEILGRKAHRHPNLGLTRESERRRHHPDDGERQAVHADDAADDAWICPEPPLPEAVTEEDHLIPPGGVFIRSEAATEDRRDAEQLGQIGGHAQAGNSLRQITLAEVEEEIPERCDVAVGLTLLFPTQEVQWGGFEPREARQPLVLEHHETIGLSERQGPEQYAVHDAEHRSRGPNAQRQDGQRDCGESGIPPQEPSREANVLSQSFKPEASPHGACILLHTRRIAEDALRSAARVLG